MGKAANRTASEQNGATPPQMAALQPQGGREATREELLMALNRERNEHAATRAQREANMNQNATLIATCNEQGQVIQQLQAMVQDLQKQVAAAKEPKPGPGKAATNGGQPKAAA